MMHYYQQRQSSTFLRSLNRRNRGVSLSNDCSSVLSIASRRCSPNRSRTPAMVSPCSRCSSSASTSSSYPVLLSVFAWSVTLLLIFSCLDIADARELTGHEVDDESFKLQCTGIFDASIFARLERICEDCYNMYREREVYTRCMENCFFWPNFGECVDRLLLQDEIPQLQQWISQLNGTAPLDQ